MVPYYDLIVGLHPDEATRAVAEAALIRPAVLIPCCNFWSAQKLGRDELIESIERYYREHAVRFQRVGSDLGPQEHRHCLWAAGCVIWPAKACAP